MVELYGMENKSKNGVRFVYVDGDYCLPENAKISIFDRGFLMADAIYEVIPVINKKLVDFNAHDKRFTRSCRELGITKPLTKDQFLTINRKLISLNKLKEGIIYTQITRGKAERDFLFPKKTHPTVVSFTQSKSITNTAPIFKGLRIKTMADLRWGRCDIKTTQLLAASIAKTKAHELGYDDVWMIKDNFITEGSSSNAHIITQNNVIVTCNESTNILSGITRDSIIKYATDHGYKIEERQFSLEEAFRSKECFSSSSSTFVMPVISINDQRIGNGKPGIHTQFLLELCIKEGKKRSI